MSSPVDRDFGPDEPSPYAPKWVREAADARRGRAAERRGIAPKAPENLEGEDVRRSADPSAAANEPVLVDRYRLPPSLEPTLMPEWPVPRTRSALGLLMRFAVAVAIAAVVALFVVGKFPTSWLSAGKAEKQDSPSFGLRFSGQNAGTAEQPKPAPAQLSLSQDGPRGTREAIPPGVKLTRTVEGATAAQAPAGLAAQPPQASPVAQPPAGPAKSFPIRQLHPDNIPHLIRLSPAFIATGDLASARLVLQRAAQRGAPHAAPTR